MRSIPFTSEHLKVGKGKRRGSHERTSNQSLCAFYQGFATLWKILNTERVVMIDHLHFFDPSDLKDTLTSIEKLSYRLSFFSSLQRQRTRKLFLLPDRLWCAQDLFSIRPCNFWPKRGRKRRRQQSKKSWDQEGGERRSIEWRGRQKSGPFSVSF